MIFLINKIRFLFSIFFAFKQALKKPQENLIVSPISIQLVLALAYAGAKENTATEMAKTLHLPEKLDDVLKGHKMLIEQLQVIFSFKAIYKKGN